MGAALRKTTIEIDWKINNAGLQQANQETDRMISKAGQMERNFNKTKTSVDGTTQAVKGNTTSLSQASQKASEYGAKSEAAFRNSTGSATSAKDKVVDISTAYEKAGRSAGTLGSQSENSAKRTQNSLSNTKGNVIDLHDRFKELDDGITGMSDRASKGIENGIRKPLGIVKGMLTGIAASAGLAGAGSMVNAGIERLSAIEDAKLSLDVMMNDSGRAQQFMDKVLAFAKTTPYAFQTLSTQAKNLFAYNMSEDRIVPTLKAMGDLSAASGKGAEGLDSLGRAFGKMQVLGKVGMEELNIITESGVPALKILANSYKLPVEKMREQISSGKVDSTKAINAIVDGVEHGTKGIAGKTVALGGVMEKLKGTWKGALDTMKSGVTSTMATLFEPIKPKLQQGMIWFAGEFKKLPEITAKIGQELKPAIKPTKDILKSAGTVIREDIIPAAVGLAKSLGPGIVGGAVMTLKGLGWTLEHVVAPPFKVVNQFIKDNPEGMKKVGKYAGIGLAAFTGYKVISSVFKGVKKKVDSLVTSIARIGSTTTTAALESNVALQSMNTTIDGKRAGNILPANASRSGNMVDVSKSTKGIGKQSFLTKLFGGTAKSDISLLESSGKKLNLFQKAKFGMSSTGALGKLVGGVGLLGVLSSATELIGMNKKNAGSKVGGFGGSVGGMAGGAAIGTAIAPGIGTAIGGAIGAFAGSSLGKSLGNYLQKKGPKMFDKLKTGWKGLSNWAEKHPLLGSSINVANKFGSAVKKNWKASVAIIKAGAKEVKDFFADPLTVDAGGKGVSKSTAKAMNKYLKKEQKLVDNRTDIQSTGRVMTKKELNTNLKTRDSMASQLTKATDKKTDKSNKGWNKLVSAGVVSSELARSKKYTNNETAKINKKDIKNNNEQLKKLEKDHYHDQQVITKNAEEKINAIKDKARKEGRKNTKKELDEIDRIEKNAQDFRRSSQKEYNKEIKKLEDKQRNEATIALSKSAKEQKIILGNLEDSKGKMSAKAAAKTVKNSAKARDGVIKEANKEYRGTKKILDEKRYVTGEISEKEYKEAIKKAKKKRDGQIDAAEETHKKTVKEAQKQAKGHKKEIDWETGETLSKWDQFKNDFLWKTGEMVSGVAQKWINFGEGFLKVIRNVKFNAGVLWEGLKNNTFGIINKAITGINKVLGFFNIGLIPLIGSGKTPPKQENKLSSSEKKKYHSTSQSGNLAMNYTGSNSASGQIMAGEEGFEIAYNKNSAKARILGANGPEITHVEPGTKILNHSDSKKMVSGGIGSGKVLPGFAKGNTSFMGAVSDMAGKAVDVVKEIGSKAAVGFDKALKFASDPIKGVKNLLLNRPGLDKKSGSGKLANGMIDHFGSKAGEWLKDKLGNMAILGGGPAGPSGKGAKAWVPIIKQAAMAMKVDLSASELSGVVSQIHRESGGNQRIVQSSAVVDVNTLSGNPARGLLQYIPSTFKAYAVKGHGNIYSGYDQLLAFFNNSTWRNDLPYGRSGWGPHGKRRFAKGGRPPVKETVLVGEEGPELFETDAPGHIHTAQQTKQLLNKRSGNGGTTINFNPTININVEGSNADASSIRDAVKAEMEKQFEKLVTVYKPEGV